MRVSKPSIVDAKRRSREVRAEGPEPLSPVPGAPDDPDAVSLAIQEAQRVIGEAAARRVGNRIPDTVMLRLVDVAYEFCVAGAGIKFRTYQRDPARRLIRSVLMEDADEITALFARQMGKTEFVACSVAGLVVLLPKLATLIPDERIQKFRDGFWVGVFGPDYETLGVMTSRIRLRLKSATMAALMADPDIDLKPDRDVFRLPNGSLIDGISTNPRVTIEGRTYHLIIVEESQSVPDVRIKKDIHPMGAATAATVVKIGTPGTRRCEFHDACQRNRRRDAEARPGDQNHFEYDFTAGAKENPRYARYVQKEMERLGFDSDEFKMSYRLHWMFERGQAVDIARFTELGVATPKILRAQRGPNVLRFPLSPNLVTFDSKNSHVAAIDIGRDNNSTVVTIGRPWFENPVPIGDRTYFHTHVVNWLEIVGDDHEKQYPRIVEFLKNYRILRVVVDSTGKGDPVADRLRADLQEFGIEVVRYVFSDATKDHGYRVLLAMIEHGLVTYPASAHTKTMQKHRRFMSQFEQLVKDWRGRYLVIHKPDKDRNARDDYPDSLMMLVMGTQQDGGHQREVETQENPFFPRRGDRAAAMRGMRAWWRGGR